MGHFETQLSFSYCHFVFFVIQESDTHHPHPMSTGAVQSPDIFVLKNLILNEADEGEVYMKELISYIAQSLVDQPGEVTVSEVQGNQTTVLELKVAKEDLGKVIGKQGRTAQAMRTILSAVSSKIKKRTVLEIIE